MMELQNDIVIQCTCCGERIYISKESVDSNVYSDEHHLGMGTELLYHISDDICCPNCGRPIHYEIHGSEYPAGAYNNDWADISGNGVYLERPRMDIIYEFYDDEIDEAYNAADLLQRRIIRISQNPDEVFNMTSRQFEELVERLYQNMGFRTTLTPATRDGGKDIIAKKYYESNLPIVRYTDCKLYSLNHTVGEPIIRGIHGVLHDNRIKQVVIVTTSRFTRDAFDYAKRQGTQIELVDGYILQKMIEKDAERYYKRFR